MCLPLKNEVDVSMLTDAVKMDDEPDVDMDDGYYGDYNDNTTDKSHPVAHRVSHMISNDSYHVNTLA